MNNRWHSLVQILTLAVVFFSALLSEAVTVAFTQYNYRTSPGSTIQLITRLSAPIPNGLEGYAIKMEFPVGALTLSTTDIAVPAELDYGLIDPGAARSIGQGFAAVAGYVELGQPAYTGTAFVVFTITIPANVAPGNYAVNLAPLLPVGVNFVDGLGNPVDDTFVFGTANLEIVTGRPEETLDDVSISMTLGYPRVTFTGLPGWSYTIQAMDDPSAGWTTVGTVIAPQNGKALYSDFSTLPTTARFYRVMAGN